MDKFASFIAGTVVGGFAVLLTIQTLFVCIPNPLWFIKGLF